jgi:hypothetical protein
MAGHLKGKLRRLGGTVRQSEDWLACELPTFVESTLAHCQPLLNCLLFFLGSYVAVRHPPQYLGWIGIPHQLLVVSDAWEPLIVKLGIYLGSCLLILAAVDGAVPHRIFAALLFPFLPSAGIAVSTLATRAATLFSPATDEVWATIARSSVFGLTAALLVCLPLLLFYRARATAIAGLVLMPAAARTAAAKMQQLASTGPYWGLLLQSWSYVWFLIVVALLCEAIKRVALTHDWRGRSRPTKGGFGLRDPSVDHRARGSRGR